jgi:hypothetical protein
MFLLCLQWKAAKMHLRGLQCLSVRLSPWNNSRTAKQIFRKADTGELYNKNFQHIPTFIKIRQKQQRLYMKPHIITLHVLSAIHV